MHMTSLAGSVKSAFIYIGLGLCELFKYKKFLLSYFLVALFLSAVVALVKNQLSFDGWRETSYWYFRLSEDATIAVTGVFLIQYILRRYRPVLLDGRTIGLCLLWFASSLIVQALISYPLFSFNTYLAHYANYDQLLMVVPVPRIVGAILMAAVMVWIGFYPFLVFEGVKQPFQENLKLIKKCGLSLAMGWVLVWCVTASLAVLARHTASDLLLHTDLASPDNKSMLFFLYDAQRFLVSALLGLVPTAITTAAFLRETGERSFLGQLKYESLTKKQTDR